MAIKDDDTWEALKRGPVYADWETQTPVMVWVVDHAVYAHHAIAVAPFEGFSGLVWALVEASCVSRSGSGIAVEFWKRGCTGWFPPGNALLGAHVVKGATLNSNVV